MYTRLIPLLLFFIIFLYISCTEKVPSQQASTLPGGWNTEEYLEKLSGNRVGMVVNHTSMINGVHLVDTLAEMGIHITAIFAPEHGFRGTSDAGAHISDTVDVRTGAPIVSLYGNKKKPAPEDVAMVDIMVFDIQDVGVRFYTYISTLHYVMEACAENGIPLIVLDRPNPNGHYVDGSVLDTAYRSFVGMHPVPVVYGLTIGEYATMINGEGWLTGQGKCELEVIPCSNYNHDMMYELPVKPSPNLPNLRSILLYPSLCFFEGTAASIGRGTQRQFQVIGHPAVEEYTYSFVPEPQPGATSPKLQGDTCYGESLADLPVDSLFARKQIDLTYLIKYYDQISASTEFFTSPAFFDKLAGSDDLREAIISGQSEHEIRSGWQEGIREYSKIRERYLMYDM